MDVLSRSLEAVTCQQQRRQRRQGERGVNQQAITLLLCFHSHACNLPLQQLVTPRTVKKNNSEFVGLHSLAVLLQRACACAALLLLAAHACWLCALCSSRHPCSASIGSGSDSRAAADKEAMSD